jgi:type VII secretion-associated serine protease mycosin
MRPLQRGGAAFSAALLLPAVLAVAGLGLATPAAAGTESLGQRSGDSAPAQSWARVGASVRMAPERLLSSAPAAGRVRIVSMQKVGGRPTVSVRVATGRTAALAAVEAAQAAPGALSVAVDTRVHADATPSNDAYRSSQWALDRLRAEDTWATQVGTGVTVAVVDSGVDKTHPDLAGQVLPGTDFVAPGDGSADGHGHGTHVGGIIAAVANNGIGVAGLSPGVKLLPVRVLDNTGAGWSSDTAAGIVWAVDHGAQVINLSLGGPSPTTVGQQAVDYAVAHGVVVVAAAGNGRATGNQVNYPAAYAGVVGVAATDRTDATASFSNTGAYVDIAAPGVGIASTYPGGGYANMSGTSMATPYAAAAAALVKSANPSLGSDAVTAVLEQSALDLAPAGRDDASGYGLIDPSAAVCLATGCASQPVPTSTAPGPGAAPAPAPVTPVTPVTPVPPPAAGPVPAVTLSPGALSVRYGATISGSARLVDRATGSGLARKPLQVCTRKAPARAYSCTTYVTDSTGTVRYRWTARANATTYAAYRAGSAAVTSPTVAYTVIARASVRTSGGSLVATVKPASKQRVTLYRHAGSGWVVVAQRTVDARGDATFSRLKGARYRVKVASSQTLRGVTSSFVRVR